MTIRRTPLRWWSPTIDLVAGVVVFILINTLIQLSIRNSGATAAEPIDRAVPNTGIFFEYWTMAGLTIVILVVGFIVAVKQGRLPAIIVYPIIGIVALGTVLLFAISLNGAPADTPELPRRPACYGPDSEGCYGG